MLNPDLPQVPPCLPGFEHVNRYIDKRMKVPAAKILPGEFYVSTKGEMIATVLGSCISACIRDKKLGVGGMNHFMLPVQGEHSSNFEGTAGAALRYGNWAMEYLINEILKQGGRRENLEAKLFGGGAVLSGMTSHEVGNRNIEFAKAYLVKEGIPLLAEDVGGLTPRKVLYFPDTGSVKMRRLRHVNNDTITERENSYAKKVETEAPSSGSVELF
ncbi:MAG: chemoreceptor glutamine deamidase CheD [Cellvibrionaceae bacterium]